MKIEYIIYGALFLSFLIIGKGWGKRGVATLVFLLGVSGFMFFLKFDKSPMAALTELQARVVLKMPANPNRERELQEVTPDKPIEENAVIQEPVKPEKIITEPIEVTKVKTVEPVEIEIEETPSPWQFRRNRKGKRTARKQVKPTFGGLFHPVRRGETLSSLSRQHGTSVRQIMAWNDLKTDRIQIGQNLRVK